MRAAVDQERAAFRGRGRHARPARRAGRPVQGRERQPDGIQARQADQERGIPVRQGLRRIRLGHGVVPRRLGARAAHGPRFRGPGRGPRALRRRVGCGKTHMAIATGMLACERGMPVRFFTASSLVMRLRRARDENRLDAELRAIGRARLLVIDELGYLPIDIDGARLLFQVVADSYEKRSVVFTTNLEFGRWGEVFGDGDMAAAVIDRIVHHGRIVRFRGESYRNSHSLMK